MAYPHARSARGAALIIAMVLVAVLAVVALALVRRTNNEMDAIGGKRNYDRSVSCAEAGRQMLLSQFRIQTVQAVAKGSGAGVNGASASMDSANRLTAAGLGGTVYRFNVVCADSSSDHQSEVEFEVRFGL